eukprot:scaffold19044_cov67-Cyclotella_meneghiniana.AAC.3
MRLVASSGSAALIEAGLQYIKNIDPPKKKIRPESLEWMMAMSDRGLSLGIWDGSGNLCMSPCIRVCRRWAIQHQIDTVWLASVSEKV